MAVFAEFLFPILDYLAQQLAYVCWVPTIVAFVTLRVSSDSGLQFARMARISSISTPCLFAFYFLYILSLPAASFTLIVFSFSSALPLLLMNRSPFFWLVYGDDAISADMNSLRSLRLSIEQSIKNKYMRSVALVLYDFLYAFGALGSSLFYLIWAALSDARKYDSDQVSLQTSSVTSVISLALLVWSIPMKNKDLKKQMAEERSKNIITEEAAAEFANEKVAKQDSVAA